MSGPRVGSRLGNYEITAKLGEGGMGEVFRARDSRLNREVALKVLPTETGADAERLERFRREAQAVAALNHPNIVTLYSFEESGDVCFLTMELVEGAALDTLIPPGGFELESWLEIGAALADAVAAAHARGIVHRDLKPANIMIGGAGDRRQVKVLDFGLARMTESGTEAPANAPTLLTRDGVVMGTLPYMSPEQVRGVALDERTDLFSLGVILYEMAAGRRPFHGESSVELGSAILRDPPPPFSGRHEKLPPDVERILKRCLEKEPRDRIASARALYDELRLLRRDVAASVPAARRRFGRRFERWPRRGGIPGRGTALQAQRQRRRAHGAGRGIDGSRGHWALALLVLSRHRPERDVSRRQSGRGRPLRGQGSGRPLRDGGEHPPGGGEGAPRGAARRHDFRGPSLGRDL